MPKQHGSQKGFSENWSNHLPDQVLFWEEGHKFVLLNCGFFFFPFLCPVYFMALLFLLLFLLTGSREKQVSSLGKQKTQQKIFGRIYIYIYMYIFTYVHMYVCLLLWCIGSEQGHVQPSLNNENVNIGGKTLNVKIQLVL